MDVYIIIFFLNVEDRAILIFGMNKCTKLITFYQINIKPIFQNHNVIMFSKHNYHITE